jgi:hypothetical protein
MELVGATMQVTDDSEPFVTPEEAARFLVSARSPLRRWLGRDTFLPTQSVMGSESAGAFGFLSWFPTCDVVYSRKRHPCAL